ncbi:nuclear transport factor 2 family protein [Amycolatopsis sp.]|uniref:nuclear transport factor 2 family protein n=1 Tax=Amycolatopsis sp. TaxID=37632 RepID=UPI00345AC2D5
MARFIYGLDRRDWATFESALTDDFRYGFKDPEGSRWVWLTGRDEMVKRIRVTAESLVVSQHFCTNPLTRITGDEATMLVTTWPSPGPRIRPAAIRR